MARLLILGAGGHGRSVAEIVVAENQHEFVGFLDDAPSANERVDDWRVLGPISLLDSYRRQADVVIVAIGSNRLREELHSRVDAAGFDLLTVTHPRAIVSARARIGRGCAVMAGAIVANGASLGEGVIVNCGAVIDHDCRVEDFGHLGVNACMGGGSVLGRAAWMQAGATLGCGVHIKAGAVLQPGSSVGAH